MITVHVWAGDTGHAALTIEKPGGESLYLSYTGSGDKLDDSVTFSPARRRMEYTDDCASHSRPPTEVRLRNLDEEAVWDFVHELLDGVPAALEGSSTSGGFIESMVGVRGNVSGHSYLEDGGMRPRRYYNLALENCSTMVKEALYCGWVHHLASEGFMERCWDEFEAGTSVFGDLFSELASCSQCEEEHASDVGHFVRHNLKRLAYLLSRQHSMRGAMAVTAACGFSSAFASCVVWDPDRVLHFARYLKEHVG
jgi:hypothetical protein